MIEKFYLEGVLGSSIYNYSRFGNSHKFYNSEKPYFQSTKPVSLMNLLLLFFFQTY